MQFPFIITLQSRSEETSFRKRFLADEKSPNVFLHLWSLGVEMQFYLIVPFIFLFLQILKKDVLKFIAVLLTAIIGCIAFLCFNSPIAFNFMPLRLWQFAAGFCALYWNKLNPEEELPEKLENVERPKWNLSIGKEDFVTVGVAVLIFCVFPSRLDVQVIRPIVTFTTAFLIIAETKDNKVLLKLDWLVYTGNISYIVYLVHWPVLSLFSIKANFQCDLLVILLTIISSVILHHLYEKPYLNWNWIQIVSLVSTLIIANAFVQYSVREYHFLGADVFACSSKIIDANEALEFNFYSSNPNLKDECMMRDMDPPVPAANLYQYCLSPPGNGTLKIMNIGNSYAKNLNEPIRDPFKFNYSEFRYLSVLGGFAIFNDPDTQPHTDLFRQQVQKYKPDVLFITARFSDYFKLPIQDNDQLVQEINDNIKFFEKHAKKIYIMGSMPVFRFNFMNHFLQYVISKPEDLEKLNLDQKIADEERKHAVERLNRVECEKCKIYDPSPEFLENGKYLTFDRNTTMSYVDNSIHITETGFKLLEPTYAKLAREAMDMV